MTARPLVTVCVVSYNQAAFIRSCLRGLVDQRVSFDFEIVVGDDCSTDSTRNVISEFQREYPEKIRPLLHEENVGALRNYRLVHRAAKGEFVAHIDGDDAAYQGKLQAQVDYLLAHPGSSLVAHRMAIFEGDRHVRTTASGPETISLNELLAAHPWFLNSSIMYRRSMVGMLFEADEDFIDFYLFVFAATRGQIGFIDQVLGRYNANVGISRRRTLMPHIQRAIDLAVTATSSDVIGDARVRQYRAYARAALLAGDFEQFAEFSRAAAGLKPHAISTWLSGLAKLSPNVARAVLARAKDAKSFVERLRA